MIIKNSASLGNGREYTPKIAASLCDLFSDNLDTAMTASNDLWASLCHQYVFVSSAPLPAYPFLRLALDNCKEKIQVEILDIINGLAQCTHKGSVPWEKELRQLLKQDLSYYQSLTASSNEDIAIFHKKSYPYSINENLLYNKRRKQP